MKKLTIINPVIFVMAFLMILSFIKINTVNAQEDRWCGGNGGHKDDDNMLVGRITYSNIAGRDTNATHGNVKLFKVNPPSSDVMAVDSADVNQNGYYIIPGVPPGAYYIVAYPGDKVEDYMISFYPSGQLWTSATKIVIPPGPGQVRTYNVRSELMYETTGGTPVTGEAADSSNHNAKLRNAIITARSGNQWRGFAITDNQGKYIINSILPGSYNITATRFGYRNHAQNVNITSSPATVNFYMGRDTSFTIAVSNNSIIVKDFKLNQNYPNPFNPSTEISFTLDKPMDVKLDVYTIDGKFIKELLSGYKQAGDYRISFSGENLSSGVYNYVMETGTGQRESKLMVFTK
ncbi:MAG: carboxypeptidase regulatory-like domain-containing protein [Bacteroidetes bacterium]|nr:carboxypeptidase regulatory-like domain-containing protein [Bacteroidota bacterium]